MGTSFGFIEACSSMPHPSRARRRPMSRETFFWSWQASRIIVLQVCMCSVVWVAYFLFGCSTSLFLAALDPAVN